MNYENQKILTQQVTRLYQNILSIIPEGLAVINSDKKLLYANPTLKKILHSNERSEIIKILMNLGKNNGKQQEKTVKPSLMQRYSRESSNKQIKMGNEQSNNVSKIDQSEVKISYQRIQNKIQEKRFSSTSKYQCSSSTFAILDCVNQPYVTRSARDILRDYNMINKDAIPSIKSTYKLPISNIQRKSNISISNNLSPEKQKIDSEPSKVQSVRNEEDSLTPKNLIESRNNTPPGNIKINYNSMSYNGPKPRTSLQIPSTISKAGNGNFESISKIPQPIQKNQPKDQTIPSQSNFHQFGSEQSEILSFQGFGFNIGEEDSGTQYPQLQGVNAINKQRKRASESYSIKANIDQNSIMTESIRSSNKVVGKMYNSIAVRMAQIKSAEVPFTIEEVKESKCLTENEGKVSPVIEPANTPPINDGSKDQSFFRQLDRSTELQLISQQKRHSQKSFFYEKNRQLSINKVSVNNNTNSVPIKDDRVVQLQQLQDIHSIQNKFISKQKEQAQSSNQNSKFTLKVKSIGNVSSANKIDTNIQLKKTDVSDILDNIFKSSLYEVDDQIKEGGSNEQPLNQSKSNEEQNHLNPHHENASNETKERNDNGIYESSTNHSKKRNSFMSHLKKGQQTQDMSYLQQKDNITKIQVKYRNKDLVVQFLLVDMYSDNSKNHPLVLIMVQDVWQELYYKKVQDLQKEKMKIFGSLSHELRTPLNCSISMLEVLRDELSQTNPEFIEEYLNPALFSNKLLLNQINDILDFVQMDCGKFKYSFFEFNIQNLLKDCTKLVSMQAQMKNILLKTVADPKVPEIISSDPNRIRQIILNFLSNSLKFTKQGYIEVGIKYVENGIYQIYVKDTGIGITESNLKNLFNFCGKINYSQQDESLNRQGVGLGLTISNSIAKDLVDRNEFEGGIKVESRYGDGSTFSIIIQDKADQHEGKIKEKKEQQHCANNMSISQLKEIHCKQEEEEKQKNYMNQIEYSSNTNSKCDSAFNKALSKIYNQTFHAQSSISDISPDQVELEFLKNQCGSPQLSFDNKKLINNGQNDSTTPINYDSAVVIEEEDNSRKYFKFQPEIKTNHQYWLQQDINLMRSRQNSKQQKQHQAQEEQESRQLQEKEHSSIKSEECTEDQSNSSSLNQVHSDKTLPYQEHQNRQQQSTTSIEKRYKKCNSQKGNLQKQLSNISNYKSILSIKNNVLDTDNRSQLDQEGFTSYITFNNKKMENTSSMTIPNSLYDKSRQQAMFMRNQTAKQYSQTSIMPAQNFQESPYQEEKKVNQTLQQQQQQQESQPNGNYLVDLINYNINQSRMCSCPQIIIVDDNQFNLYALSKIIKQFQFSCLTISDSLDVLNQIKALFYNNCCQKPKIIFMDIEMPHKNGYEVALEIHKFYHDVELLELPVIIACTAYIGQEDRDKALSSGMDDFINKPILKNAFIQLLINWQHIFH